MSAVAEESPATKETDAGKRYRLVVRSADEAVRVIQEKFGARARVVSVKQVGGQGLSRFISSPKLEIIAEIPPEGAEADLAEPPESFPPSEEAATATTPEPVAPQVAASASIPEAEASPAIPPSTAPGAPLAPEQDFGEVEGAPNVARLLARAGFDSALMAEIRAWDHWGRIKDLPLAEALREITIGLTDRYNSMEHRGTTDRIALIGPPGVGKTTTLCKFIAHEVFMNKTTPSVLKVENGVPNPDDALRIFCDVVGVTLHREPTTLPEVSPEAPLYLDFPGISLSHEDDWIQTNETLDLLGVDTRVLVVNAAYDREVIDKASRLASLLGATHVALTHFDELSNSSKLFSAVLRSGLTPLCVCYGQNVTGDFSTKVLGQLIARAFPEQLYAGGVNRQPG